MADVTVKQLAQVVGIPVERLLTHLQEAGLTIANELQTINEDEKRILLDHLKNGSANKAKAASSSQITLRRKSISQVAGHDVHSGKKVNIEVRKKRVYEKSPVKDPIEEVVVEEIIDETNLEIVALPEEAPAPEEVSTTNNEIVDSAEVVVDNMQKDEELLIEEVVEAVEEVELVTELKVVPSEVKKEDKTDKAFNKKESEKEQGDSSKADFKRGKRKGKHATPNRSELEENSNYQRRSKFKKRKSDKYREAEDSLTHQFEMPTTPTVHYINVPETISVSDLAKKMSVKATEVIKTMIQLGAMATINQVIDQETAMIVVEEMGHKAFALKDNAIEVSLENDSVLEGEAESRAPVVTIMGHVDHGKTSLLDYIREAKVVAGEAGGITQHIGAYNVNTDKGNITFLDTPGHAAFTAMRARGAKVTDLVVLIVAADDGVKPQTIEAIMHARAAKVPMIVAINKIDKPGADPERVMNELSAKEVIPEAWGGDTMFVNISAKSGEGIDNLLDAILLQSEVLELKAHTEGSAKGIVIESRLDKGRGPVATILVQSGRLKKGDILLAGLQYGRVRALFSDNGTMVDSAGPSIPVEIQGLSAIPHAGDEAIVVTDEKRAREVALFRQGKFRDVKLARRQKSTLEGIFEDLAASDMKTLNIVLKADMQGSVEAIAESLIKLSNEEVKIEVISSGVGGITESDAQLAIASGALLIGFNVRADVGAKRLSEQESFVIHYFSVIYDIVDQVKGALTGMLAPKFKEEIVGIAEVRDVFRSPKMGSIAGCMVIEGVIKRNNPIRVLRNNVVIYEGTLESLRRFKDDASEVKQGIECGIGVKNYNDVKVGDLIEVFEIIEIKREAL